MLQNLLSKSVLGILDYEEMAVLHVLQHIQSLSEQNHYQMCSAQSAQLAASVPFHLPSRRNIPVSVPFHPNMKPAGQTGKSCPRDSPGRMRHWLPPRMYATSLGSFVLDLLTRASGRKHPDVRRPHLCSFFGTKYHWPHTYCFDLWFSNTSILLSTPHTDDVIPGSTHCPTKVDILLIWAAPGRVKQEHLVL